LKSNRAARVLVAFSTLILAYLALLSFWEGLFLKLNTSSQLRVSLYFLAMLALIAGFLFLIWQACKRLERVNPKLVAAAVFLVSYLLRSCFVLVLDAPQYSDFLLFYWLTNMIARGDHSYISQHYTSVWAYQLGFPALFSPIAMFFENNTTPLLLVNIAFQSGATVFLYLICNKLLDRRTAMFAAILCILWPASLSLSSVYTNQHSALFFALGAMYFVVSSREKKRAFILCGIAGVFFAASQAMRPEAFILLLALAVALISAIELINLKFWLKTHGLQLFTVVFCYFLCFQSISGTLKISGIQPYGLVNNFPLYKFAVGLNHESHGIYNSADSGYLFDDTLSPEVRNARASELIRERLAKGSVKLAELLHTKNKLMWTGKAHLPSAFAGFEREAVSQIGPFELHISTLVSAFSLSDSAYNVLLFTAAAFACFMCLRRRNIDFGFLFPLLGFMAFFVVFLLIEVQARYRYLPMTLLLIAAMYALKKPEEKLNVNPPA